jgi:UDP-4-amino-4,6-dideoxy-N-acetyl-beta-L-altrosamine N-acetyltransferase
VLRPANDSDTDHIRRWRNHPQVRAVSLSTHEISATEHEAWFAAARVDPRRRVLVYEYEGTPAGVINFTGIDPAARTATWGFYLDVDGLDQRGETLPAWMAVQREAVDYAFDSLDLDVLTGEVLEANTVVRRMNKRLGFTEGEPEVVAIEGSDVRVYPIRLSRAEHDARARARKESA